MQFFLTKFCQLDFEESLFIAKQNYFGFNSKYDDGEVQILFKGMFVFDITLIVFPFIGLQIILKR